MHEHLLIFGVSITDFFSVKKIVLLHKKRYGTQHITLHENSLHEILWCAGISDTMRLRDKNQALVVSDLDKATYLQQGTIFVALCCVVWYRPLHITRFSGRELSCPVTCSGYQTHVHVEWTFTFCVTCTHCTVHYKSYEINATIFIDHIQWIKWHTLYFQRRNQSKFPNVNVHSLICPPSPVFRSGARCGSLMAPFVLESPSWVSIFSSSNSRFSPDLSV